jgi:hypothetical protein
MVFTTMHVNLSKVTKTKFSSEVYEEANRKNFLSTAQLMLVVLLFLDPVFAHVAFTFPEIICIATYD